MRRSILVIATFLIPAANTFAADWGYDDEPVPKQAEQNTSIVPSKSIGKSSTENKRPATNSKPASLFYDASTKPSAPISEAVAKPAAMPAAKPIVKLLAKPQGMPVVKENKPSKLQQAINSWGEVFDLMNANSLDEASKQKLGQYLDSRAKQTPADMQAVLSINNYWPKVKLIIAGNAEQKNNYQDLFKALLRVGFDAAKVKNPNISQENISDVIVQVLGPVRISIADNPNLTEDSINAYADMACFLYEQKNPGKTIDADDNRAVFATVIREKFKNAPSKSAKQAMANFAINWYKFKIAWGEADDKSKQDMVKHLASEGVSTALNAGNNPVLDSVLKNWQWP